VRNQRQNASQEHTTSSKPGGSGLGCGAHLRSQQLLSAEETPRLGDVASREATVKACGVAVAKPQGHSWAPPPSNGSRVNVGTIPMVPSLASSQLAGGKVCRRPMPLGWGGGPVVVRDRESRSHGPFRPPGEGVQRIRSLHADREGRR